MRPHGAYSSNIDIIAKSSRFVNAFLQFLYNNLQVIPTLTLVSMASCRYLGIYKTSSTYFLLFLALLAAVVA